MKVLWSPWLLLKLFSPLVTSSFPTLGASHPLLSSLTSFSCSRLSTLDHSSIWVSTFRGSSKWFMQHPLLLTCLAAPPPQHTHLGRHSFCCHASFTLCERLGGSWLTLTVPTMDPPSIPMCSAGLQATELGVSASALPVHFPSRGCLRRCAFPSLTGELIWLPAAATCLLLFCESLSTLL